MSYDKELEIRRQFLDEAQEYLDTLDSAVLGLSSSRIDIQKINAALRAAHSIKGGAAMMGFQLLSQLSHRLEDSFKALKTQKQALEVDASLENLLLNAVSCLRHIINCDRQNIALDPHWIASAAEPLFDQLYDRLGDPEAEDATTVLGPEDGQDIIPVLFETEVEGCLQRLEAVLADPEQPCLREELTILAQELGGLGEMLQLNAFSHLCESVMHCLDTTSTPVATIAQSALQAWRRTQSLVLAGQFDLLPTAIEGVPTEALEGVQSLSAVEELQENWLTEAWEPETWQTETWEAATLSEEDWQKISEPWLEEFAPANTEASEEVTAPEFLVAGIEDDVEWEVAASELSDDMSNAVSDDTAPEEHYVDATPIEEPVAQQVKPPRETQVSDFKVLEIKPEASPPLPPEEDQDATVRVAVRQLNHLNDLFGELTIERNGLDLCLKRLRGLTRTLIQRVRLLDESNSQMRTTYDRVTLGAIADLKLPIVDFSAGSHNAAHLYTDAAQNLKSKTQNPNFDDGVNNRFDTLEMDQYNDLHLLSQQLMETIVQVQEVTSDIELSLEDTEQVTRDLNKTSKQLQMSLTHVRMRPLSDVVDRFPRALRELSLQYGKQVKLAIHGSSTLIDRNILEAINDPLMHLLRNAFDHGIEDPETRRACNKPEEGTIEIRAVHRGNRTLITVSDDGKGIPLDKIRSKAEQMGLDPTLLAAASDQELLSLIFEPGFSTSEQVTALSGRGVGMDVVRSGLRQIRGEITVNTEAGVGTTFTLSVPFTLSVVQVLLVESNGMILGFPTDAIEEMLLLRSEDVVTTAGSRVLSWQGNLVQLIDLSRWLQFNCPRQPQMMEMQPAIGAPSVLMVNQGEQLVGLQMDCCWGEQEVAVRRIEGNLPMPPGFNSCAILGDGRVVPLVNVSDLLHWIASCDRVSGGDIVALPASTSTPASEHMLALAPAASSPTSSSSVQQPITLLIVDDSINVRRFLALTLERAGYRVEQAKDGQDALEKLQRGLVVQAVVCDIEMPRLDGYGFLAKVKANSALSHIPITMLTSRSGDKHRQLAMNLGAAAYFAKPYNEQSLLRTLEQLISVSVAPV